jgi:hypothetical protein
LGGWLVNVGRGVWILPTFIGVDDMKNIDLIIDALYKTKLLFESHGQYPHTLREVDEALAAARELKAELAKLAEPPDYVEPPTSDYHNGWEEGFEAAKNLFKEKNT